MYLSVIEGGCGAIYQISIEAEEFRGKRTVQQHMLVNEVGMVTIMVVWLKTDLHIYFPYTL